MSVLRENDGNQSESIRIYVQLDSFPSGFPTAINNTNMNPFDKFDSIYWVVQLNKV